MTVAIPVSGRTTSLEPFAPGACCLAAGTDGPDLALIVTRAGRREALLLNRRSGGGGHLPIVSGLADAAVLAVQGVVLAPSGRISAIAPGRGIAVPGALHLGDGRAYLCGRDAAGRIDAFDVVSGVASAIDPGDLPYARRWRVIVPESGGVVTVYEAEPA